MKYCQRGEIQCWFLKFNVLFEIMAGDMIVKSPYGDYHPEPCTGGGISSQNIRDLDSGVLGDFRRLNRTCVPVIADSESPQPQKIYTSCPLE